MRQVIAVVFIAAFLAFTCFSTKYGTNVRVNDRVVYGHELLGKQMSATSYRGYQAVLLAFGLYFLVTGERDYWRSKKET